MKITAGKLQRYLDNGGMKLPADILYVGSNSLVALEKADGDIVQTLINQNAIEGIGGRTVVSRLRLTKPLSEIKVSIRQQSLPIAEDSRTTYRTVIDGKSVYSHSLRRSEAFAYPRVA
jgi:hypothetical protein